MHAVQSYLHPVAAAAAQPSKVVCRGAEQGHQAEKGGTHGGSGVVQEGAREAAQLAAGARAGEHAQQRVAQVGRPQLAAKARQPLRRRQRPRPPAPAC
jgi:hypothetical protein